jgi:hypothetical protein
MAPGSIPGQCIFLYPEQHCGNVGMIQRVYVLQGGVNRWAESTRAAYHSIFKRDQWFANRRAGRPNPRLGRCPRWRRRLPLIISGRGLEAFPPVCLAFELSFSTCHSFVNRLALWYIHGWDSGCLHRGDQGRNRLVGNRRRDGNHWSQPDGLPCGYHLAYPSSEQAGW